VYYYSHLAQVILPGLAIASRTAVSMAVAWQKKARVACRCANFGTIADASSIVHAGSGCCVSVLGHHMGVV
jgi:hypothetical protein